MFTGFDTEKYDGGAGDSNIDNTSSYTGTDHGSTGQLVVSGIDVTKYGNETFFTYGVTVGPETGVSHEPSSEP